MQNWTFAEWSAAFIGLIILFFIGAALTRWVFSVGQQIKHQKAIINLLVEIAKTQGVPADKISGIINTAQAG